MVLGDADPGGGDAGAGVLLGAAVLLDDMDGGPRELIGDAGGK